MLLWWNEGLSYIEILVNLLAFLFAWAISFSLHEYAHARVAVSQGDFTPKAYGRLTINPFKHITFLGFLSFLFLGFGWGKPVPINALKFKEYKKGIFLTSIAGVVTNFVLGFLSVGALILSINLFAFVAQPSEFLNVVMYFVTTFFSLMATMNFSLCFFNLLPIYPLDGFNIVSSFVSFDNGFLKFMRTYGQFIFIIILITPIFDLVINLLYEILVLPIMAFWQFFI